MAHAVLPWTASPGCWFLAAFLSSAPSLHAELLPATAHKTLCHNLPLTSVILLHGGLQGQACLRAQRGISVSLEPGIIAVLELVVEWTNEQMCWLFDYKTNNVSSCVLALPDRSTPSGSWGTWAISSARSVTPAPHVQGTSFSFPLSLLSCCLSSDFGHSTFGRKVKSIF